MSILGPSSLEFTVYHRAFRWLPFTHVCIIKWSSDFRPLWARRILAGLLFTAHNVWIVIITSIHRVPIIVNNFHTRSFEFDRNFWCFIIIEGNDRVIIIERIGRLLCLVELTYWCFAWSIMNLRDFVQSLLMILGAYITNVQVIDLLVYSHF